MKPTKPTKPTEPTKPTTTVTTSRWRRLAAELLQLADHPEEAHDRVSELLCREAAAMGASSRWPAPEPPEGSETGEGLLGALTGESGSGR